MTAKTGNTPSAYQSANGQTVVHPDGGKLTYNNVDESQQHLKNERTQAQRITCPIILFISKIRKGNTEMIEADCHLQEPEVGEGTGHKGPEGTEMFYVRNMVVATLWSIF